MPALRVISNEQMALAYAKAPSLRVKDLLLFDGDCRFCIQQVERLKRWARNQLDALPLQTPELLETLGIPYGAAMSAMHLVTVEGGIYRGIEAAITALRHRPVLGILVRCYYVPGIKQLADLGYRLVARYRYALMGRAVARGECNGSCALHMPPRNEVPR
jgi:predicted DCC family thiol-disulfide oxidoreductase YuxK